MLDGAVIVELTARLDTWIVAYCAEDAAMFVLLELPEVLLIVRLPALKSALVSDVIPATAISTYCVKPLLVVSPQVPDSVPVTGSGRFKSVVRLTAMIYLMLKLASNSQSGYY